VALGTRGRHGENRLLLGSVAEAVVRACPVPVLTVRQLAADEE
jgi:nucleotide-binding universal stress UspA family protein